jgi:DtxR family Mn-dependent transcriptional regulator
MQPSDIEDGLEAIFTILSTHCRPATIPEIREMLGFDERKLSSLIDEMQSRGYLVKTSGEGVEITEQGRVLGERIARKHKVLECFLTEMLGIDGEKASQEACKLEHEISDETINRLSTYISSSRRHNGRCGRRRCSDPDSLSTVLDFEEGTDVRVTMVKGHGMNRRLMDLGVVPGENLHIRRKLRNNSVVVRIKGSDVALSPEVACMIHVEKTE